MPRLKLPGSLPSQISHPLPRHTRAPTCICGLCRISYKRIPVTSNLNCSVPCCPTSQKDLPPQLRRLDAIPATHSSTGQRSRGKSSYRYAVVDAGAEMVSTGPLGYQGNRDAFCQKQTPGLLPVSVTLHSVTLQALSGTSGNWNSTPAPHLLGFAHAQEQPWFIRSRKNCLSVVPCQVPTTDMLL